MPPTSLSEILKTETRPLHVAAERSPFMRRLLRGELDRVAYCSMLRDLHLIYEALEAGLRRRADDPTLEPFVSLALWREPAIARDLDALHGSGWSSAIEPHDAARAYASRLGALAIDEPPRLLAHAYVRYLGDLSGGQLLAPIVRRSLGLTDAAGTALHDFGDEVEVRRLKRAFRDRLDALALDEAQRAAVLDEAIGAFERHVSLFDELAVDGRSGSSD